MVKPENHVIYGPCPFYVYYGDVRPENDDITKWFDPDETYLKNAKNSIVKRITRTTSEPYYFGYWTFPYYDGGYYGYSDYGATDSSNDTSGGEWGGCDISGE